MSELRTMLRDVLTEPILTPPDITDVAARGHRIRARERRHRALVRLAATVVMIVAALQWIAPFWWADHGL